MAETKKAKQNQKKEKIKIISGKRKSAIAKLRIVSGDGKITFNRLKIEELNLFHKLALLEPVRIYEKEIKIPFKNNFNIKVAGGGKEAQIQAARLALARALLFITKSDALKKAFVRYDRHMIVQDTRRKETRKPGDSKARAMRQTSYR